MKEFIIRDKEDWRAVSNITAPVIGKKPFRVVLYRGLKRTGQQNKLLHSVFEDCSNKYDKTVLRNHDVPIKNADWWKRELKCKLGLKEVHFDIDEQPTVIIKSTTEYNTKEMADFCEKIVAYMKTEYNVDIELPDDLKGAK